MAKFRKLVLPPGDYVTPDGPASVPPARLRHWVDQFQAMRAAGLEVPVAWGHQPAALPSDPAVLTEAESLYRKSRYNAGWLESLEQDANGALWATGDAPGLTVDDTTGALVDSDLRTAIREVSVGVGDYRDGKGRLWEDALIHLALTPHPVWGGQSGFKAATDGGVTPMFRFGLSGLARRFSFAASGEGGGGDDKKDGDKAAPDGTDGGVMKKIIAALKDMGVNMPDGTTDENFMDRLLTALTVKAGMGGDTASTDAGAAGVTEEQPTYMGGHADPSVRILFEEVDREKRQRRLARIRALVARGCPAHVVRDLEQRAGKTYFSLDPATKKAAVPEIDRQLDLLEATLPAASTLFGQLSPIPGATAIAPPNDPESPEARAAKHREAADALASAGGLPARKTA